MIHLLLFIVCLWMVITKRINTDNPIKLIGIGFIAVGSLIGLAGKNTLLVELGVFLYFIADLIIAYFGCKKRRYYDKAKV